MVNLFYCRAAIKDVYLLEFHPSLAIASQIPAALSHAYLVGIVLCRYFLISVKLCVLFVI